LESSPLVAFVSTADTAPARTFCGETLGLRMVEESAFASAFDANGMSPLPDPVPGLI
jgi:hypothetical protein